MKQNTLKNEYTQQNYKITIYVKKPDGERFSLHLNVAHIFNITENYIFMEAEHCNNLAEVQNV